MATKADRLPNLGEFKTDAATADEAALKKLADNAAASNEKKDKKKRAIANGPSPEIIKNNWLDIEKQALKVKAAKAVLDREKQTLRSRYSVADGDGAILGRSSSSANLPTWISGNWMPKCWRSRASPVSLARRS